jgi:hypothetical protein
MNDNSTNSDLLVQYLDGELNKEQHDALQKNIQEDSALAQKLDSLRLAKDSLKSYGLKTRIHNIHAEMMKEGNNKHLVKKPGVLAKMLPYTLRIAASVLVIIGISFLYQYYSASPEKLFEENFKAFNVHESRGSVSTTLTNAYKAGDMKLVIQQYPALKNPTAEENFLGANAFLNNHQAAKAIDVFLALQQQNKNNSTHYFEEDTEYYLALAYLLNSQPQTALPMLEKINHDKNHAYHKKINTWFLTRAERFQAK